jgi:hypothetical protein
MGGGFVVMLQYVAGMLTRIAEPKLGGELRKVLVPDPADLMSRIILISCEPQLDLSQR